jgi:hypothetical protein
VRCEPGGRSGSNLVQCVLKREKSAITGSRQPVQRSAPGNPQPARARRARPTDALGRRRPAIRASAPPASAPLAWVRGGVGGRATKPGARRLECRRRRGRHIGSWTRGCASTRCAVPSGDAGRPAAHLDRKRLGQIPDSRSSAVASVASPLNVELERELLPIH